MQVKTLFIFGVDEDGSSHQVQQEAYKHCDILQVRRNVYCIDVLEIFVSQMDFVDSYWNVTLDSVSGLKIANSWRNLSGSDTDLDFVLLGDDDTYVNIPSLWSMLYEEKSINKVVGYLMLHAE